MQVDMRVPRLFAIGAALLTAAGAFAQALQRDLEGVISDARLGSASFGVVIMDPETGEVLASKNENGSFIPASNMKLLTSGAALAVLGEEFTFETTLELAGDTLVLRGSGDPAFADPKLLERMGVNVDDLLGAWVKDIRTAAVTNISKVVIDARVFDDQSIHPMWPTDQLNRWYCAEVHGLNFHGNTIDLFASPGQPGLSPTIRIEPNAHWLHIRNVARTVKKGPNTLWVARPPGDNKMKLHGNIRWATEEPVPVAMHDMPSLLGRLLRERLSREGLGDPVVEVASANDVPVRGKVISVIQTPLSIVLDRCNSDSYNLYAECLLKRFGHEMTGLPGSWERGAAVLRMVIQERLGAEFTAAVTISDGSGMSRGNQVSPMLMAAWLADMHTDDRLRDAYLESLPEAATSGTLRQRFRKNKPSNLIRAKTGYLNGVSALSGYVTNESNSRALVFSVIVNDIPRDMPIRRIKEFQEQVALVADNWLTSRVAGVE